MKELIKKLSSNRIIRFIIVGGASTVIDFILYMLLSGVIIVSVSKAISMIIASVFSFFANKLFTFENKDKTDVKYLIKFYVVFVLNLATNVTSNTLMLHLTENKIISFVVATLCGMMVNYLGQSLWVFKKAKQEGCEQNSD